MHFKSTAGVALLCALAMGARAALTPEQLKALPPAASRTVDFKTEVKPIFEATCIRCHGRGRNSGGFQIDSRETLLKGGDSGPAVVPGKSADSYLIALIAGVDPDSVMPKKGTKLTPEQVGILRAWIDNGLPWDAEVGFGRLQPKNLKPRMPEIPAGREANPVDRFVEAYFHKHSIRWPKTVDDRLFARRASLDAIGLLPTAQELKIFIDDKSPDKREQLVKQLLERNDDYAQDWLTFWNDLLRNDYKGTGYIDGGRKQITKWLYSALQTNMPYDQFVAELVSPSAESEGFAKGIVWRGAINASQTPEMQAAQNISQVFMGVNLKCASCHDSFINDWQLSDSYGLANIYSDKPLDIFRCDEPTGKRAPTKFLFPELGQMHETTNREERLRELAGLITCPQDGRLSRTIVNRLWARFMGRGLIEPVDDMDQTAWDQDLLDWLAEDLIAHHYDVKHTIAQILTSRAYQLTAVNLGENQQNEFVFQGPSVRRLSAEEFRDALTSLTGVGYASPMADIGIGKKAKDKYGTKLDARWIWNDPNAAEKAKAGSIYGRKIIELPVAPEEAEVFVVCDNSFTLFVNGSKVGSGDDYTKPFVLELKPWLKKGENVIAVHAINNLPNNTAPTPETAIPGTENPAGLFMYARVRAGKKVMDFVTDKSWVLTDRESPGWEKPGFAATDWSAASDLGPANAKPWQLQKDLVVNEFAKLHGGGVRASLVTADPLMIALGRPNREQVVTTRSSAATTLQALELTNGKTLAEVLARGASSMVKNGEDGRELIRSIYEQAVGRRPTREELKMAEEIVGEKPKKEGVEDFLWAMVLLPEFQLIY